MAVLGINWHLWPFSSVVGRFDSPAVGRSSGSGRETMLLIKYRGRIEQGNHHPSGFPVINQVLTGTARYLFERRGKALLAGARDGGSSAGKFFKIACPVASGDQGVEARKRERRSKRCKNKECREREATLGEASSRVQKRQAKRGGH